jgi:NADH dehydrogenase/NADH:ubiquinone oxidoreductase subunit G
MTPFIIDGQPVEGKEGENVLEVALDAGFDIPNLCYNESVKPYGACRLCLVEIVRNGKRMMTTACNYPVIEGIEVFTQTEKILRARRMMLELILAMCPGDKLI